MKLFIIILLSVIALIIGIFLFLLICALLVDAEKEYEKIA